MRLFFWGSILVLLATAMKVHAQDQSDSQVVQSWYKDYASNPVVLEVPFTETSLQKISQRASRYRYRLLYIPKAELERTNSQLKIGFFKDTQDAQQFSTVARFQETRVAARKVNLNEFSGVIAELEAAENKQYLVFMQDSADAKAEAKAVLDTAKDYYMKGQYSQAGRLYALLSIFADDATAAWSLELAGLCLEKQRKFPEAISRYKSLLERFPENTGSQRVKQRLIALETAADDTKSPLRVGRTRGARQQFFVRGVVGQFYRTLYRKPEGGDNEQVMSAMSSDFDLRAALREGDHSLNVRTSAWYLKDQLDEEDTEFRLKRAALQYTNERYHVGLHVGRQKNFDAGVYTAFDGLGAEYYFSESVSVGFSTGTPVYFNDTYDSFDYSFHSLYGNWEISDHWQINGYFITQAVNGVTDREALGFRGQYNNEKLSGSVNIDYDTAFSELNSLLANAQYVLTKESRIGINYGHQRSPFLSATNIMMGKPDFDLELYLQTKENKDALLDDALALTAINDFFSLNYSTSMGENKELIIDYYSSILSEVPVLTGIPGEAPSDYAEYSQQSLGARIVLQKFFTESDIANLGLRKSIAENSESTQIYVSEKLRLLSNKLIVDPRIMYTLTQFDGERSSQNLIRYSLIMSYRPLRNLEFNLDMGNETMTTEQTLFNNSSNYIYAGVRWNF